MNDPHTPLLMLFNGLGLAFSAGFVALTIAWTYLVLRLRDQAAAAVVTARELAMAGFNDSGDWLELVGVKSELEAATEKTQLVAGAIPVLALLGTVIGFFFAIAATGNAELGHDPTKLLRMMLDSGVSTALATTVVGQGLYLAIVIAYGAGALRVVHRAKAMVDETLALIRAKLSDAIAVEEV